MKQTAMSLSPPSGLPLSAMSQAGATAAGSAAEPPSETGPRILPASQLVAARAPAPAQRPDMRDVLLPNRSSPLKGLALLLIVLVAGTAAGLGSAAFVIQQERPLAMQSIGPWTANPLAGTSKADPYSAATYTRSARVPLAQGEGLALTAYTDSTGRTLSPDCAYSIEGRTPAARLWTLTAATAKGALTPSLSGRGFVTSSGLLRQEDGSFAVTASAKAASGNWLPLNPAPDLLDGLSFTFRLYDAPVTTGASLEGAVMPAIRRLSCR